VNNMLIPVVLIVVAAALAAIAAGLLIAKGKGKNRRYKAKPILTDNEREFFTRLVNALPQYRVLPQISFGALLVPAVSGKDYNATRATFSQKIADFVVCDAAMQVIAIVELDDRTHNAEKDARRDAMLEDAGYSVVRFPSRHKPDSMKIRQVFQEIVAKRERVNHEGSNNVVAIRAT
jgi:hypothetical protein